MDKNYREMIIANISVCGLIIDALSEEINRVKEEMEKKECTKEEGLSVISMCVMWMTDAQNQMDRAERQLERERRESQGRYMA